MVPTHSGPHLLCPASREPGILKAAPEAVGETPVITGTRGGPAARPRHPRRARAARHWELGLSPSVSVLKSMERACSSACGGRFHSARVKM